MPPILKQLELANFKSFGGDSEPIPLSPVTILVGANGSGKSNFLDAIRFLQGLGFGMSIAEGLSGKWEGGREIHGGLRGGPGEVCWGQQDSFTIGTWYDVPVKTRSSTAPAARAFESPARIRALRHQLTCEIGDTALVKREVLEVDGETLFEGPHLSGNHRKAARATETEFDIQYKAASPSDQRGSCKLSRTHSVLGQFRIGEQLDHCPMVHADVVALSLGLQQTYARSWFLDLRSTDLMKRYVSPVMTELGAQGENLSAIVYRICQDADDRARFIDWLAAVSAPQVVDIDFATAETGDLLVQLVEKTLTRKRKKISARSLSDGTLRFMGMLAALFSAPKGSLFLLEEVENGLHPTRLHLLVELLEQFAEARDLQIVATTHSSRVLTALSEQALKSAVLFARTNEMPGTIARRLGDLPDFEQVTSTSQIDHLFSTGWLERAL